MADVFYMIIFIVWKSEEAAKINKSFEILKLNI